jgi:excisionase family DNA binding protein
MSDLSAVPPAPAALPVDQLLERLREKKDTLAFDEPALLDVRSVAQLLACSPRHVYRLSDAGRMPPPVRLGALVRWSRRSIEEWVAAGCPSVRKGAPK